MEQQSTSCGPTRHAQESARSGARWPYTPHRTRREQQSSRARLRERRHWIGRCRVYRLDKLGWSSRARNCTIRAGCGDASSRAELTDPGRLKRQLKGIPPSEHNVFHRRRAILTDASNKTTTVTHIRHNPQYMYCHIECRAT